MSLFRFNIKGAIDIPSTPTEIAWLDDLRARLRILKNHCVVINEGGPNEEKITNFTFHICHHDTNEPCESSQEI